MRSRSVKKQGLEGVRDIKKMFSCKFSIKRIMVFRDVLPSRKPCCTERGMAMWEILAYFDEITGFSGGSVDDSMANSGCKCGGRFVFTAQIVYQGEPVMMAWYTALEPAYCFESIEMFPACQVRVNISGDGLRERGLGSCSSRISSSH